MRHFRVPLCLALAFLLFVTTGCNLAVKYELSRARKIENSGQYKDALDHYSRILTRVPKTEARLRSQIYMQMGECWLQMERPTDAFSSLQKAAEADPSNPTAQLRLGEMYLAGGASDRASEQAHKVLELASANGDGLTLLGAASSAAGNTELAQHAFESVLNSDPSRVRVAVALAEIYDQNGDTQKARETLQKAAAAQPQSSVPLLALGRLEEEEGRVAPAEDAYRRAVAVEDSVVTNTRLAKFLARTSRPEEAASVLLHADSLHRALPVARGDFELFAGDPAAALDGYSAVFNIPGFDTKNYSWLSAGSAAFGDPASKARARLAARMIEADLEIAQNQVAADPSRLPVTEAARIHLSQYRDDLDPATVALLSAEIALVARDLDSASASAKTAIALTNDSAPAYYISGIVHARSGDSAAARVDWEQALQCDQDYAPARLALAEDAVARGDFAAAEKGVIPVVRDEPENVRALVLFSRILQSQKRNNSAELLARRAAVLNSKSPEPHVLLGDIAAAQGRLATALTAYEHALTLDPRSQPAMLGLLQLYSKGRMTKPMLVSLERVADTAPPSAPLLEITARMYARQGMPRDAERCLDRVLQIDPYRTTAISALAVLRANKGDLDGALKLGARKGGSESALLSAFRAQRDNDPKTALAEYERAVRQGEASGVAENNLAWMLAASGSDLDRALALAKKARNLKPDDPAVMDTLGFVYLQRREFSSAIPILKEAADVARARNSVERSAIREHLQLAYIRSGQKPPVN